MEEFAETVANSPTLAAGVVRASNSPLYGMEGRVSRLERAVLVLGVRTVASIASTVLVATETRALDLDGVDGDAIWIHSLQVGICAQLLARHLRIQPDSEAYLAGLLHDMGTLYLADEYGARYAEILLRAAREGRRLEELEREAFGLTHASRLRELAEEWGFPEALREALGHHHDPNEAPEGSRTLASLVYAAHILPRPTADAWCDQVREDEADGEFLAGLGLTPDDTEPIRAAAEEKIKESAAAFTQVVDG